MITEFILRLTIEDDEEDNKFSISDNKFKKRNKQNPCDQNLLGASAQKGQYKWL